MSKERNSLLKRNPNCGFFRNYSLEIEKKRKLGTKDLRQTKEAFIMLGRLDNLEEIRSFGGKITGFDVWLETEKGIFGSERRLQLQVASFHCVVARRIDLLCVDHCLYEIGNLEQLRETFICFNCNYRLDKILK